MINSDSHDVCSPCPVIPFLINTFASEPPEPVENVKSVLVAIAAELLIVLLT